MKLCTGMFDKGSDSFFDYVPPSVRNSALNATGCELPKPQAWFLSEGS